MNKRNRLMVFISCIVVSCGLMAITTVLLHAQPPLEHFAMSQESFEDCGYGGAYCFFDQFDMGCSTISCALGYHADPGYDGQYTFWWNLADMEHTYWTVDLETIASGEELTIWEYSGFAANPPTHWPRQVVRTSPDPDGPWTWWGYFTTTSTFEWRRVQLITDTTYSFRYIQFDMYHTGGNGLHLNRGVAIDSIAVDAESFYTVTVTPPAVPPFDCGLDNYEFDDGSEGWGYGNFVDWHDGYVRLSGCVDELNSFISQTVELMATGPSQHYELSVSARSPVQFEPGDEPLLRWKLNSLVPGDSPNWYNAQAHIFFVDYWQHQAFILRESNSDALSDTLTIWTSNRDVEIDNVCITLHSGPGSTTPVCPIEPTYTPNATYTPLATPTAATTATATAWAATATAWPTRGPYPTVPAPDCPEYAGPGADWNFIWLMGQLLMFLAAFFEAIFQLLGAVLQPFFDLFSFFIWLAGATLSLVASLIDLIVAIVTFLFSFVELFFNILEIIGAFIVALWNLLTMSPTDPGTPPSYFGWGVEVWDFLIEGTPLEYLEIIAMAVASLLIIRWTVKQFSSWGA